MRAKRYARFNPITHEDQRLFAAVLEGDHLIRGFRNRNLQASL